MENLKNRILEIIEEKKGQDIKIYDMNGRSPFYDISIVCTSSSVRNAEAIAFDIKKEIEIRAIEGTEEANWILIDANDILVNIFQKEAREYYQLDEFYEELLK